MMSISRVKRARLAAILAFTLLGPVGVAAATEPFHETERDGSAPHLTVLLVPSSSARDAAPPPLEAAPVSLGVPVITETLADVDPDSLGLLSPEMGGLGAALWNGTPRNLVERLLPEIKLPTASPTLNGLARRLLLSVAEVPKGEGDVTHRLTSMRIEKLLALGDSVGAWQLALLAKAGQIDDITLRLVTEANLIDADSKAVCDKIPGLMRGNQGAEWQKSLILCQIRAGDIKAAQLGLDLLREQGVKNDLFLTLINRNVLGGNSKLPREMSTLRALDLAALRHMDMPLPASLYVQPDGALIEWLLQAKAADENARLALGERAAARDLISGDQLASLYQDVTFAPTAFANLAASPEKGARRRALLYQAFHQEQASLKRADLIAQFVQTVDNAALLGAMGTLLAEAAADIPVTSDFGAFAGEMTRLFALTGVPELGAPWLKLMGGSASRLGDHATQLIVQWPLFALAGMVPETDVERGGKAWVDSVSVLPLSKPVVRVARQNLSAILSLLNAAGFSIPNTFLDRVTEVAADNKRFVLPSTILLDRLHESGSANRKGEAVLFSMFLGGGGPNTVPMSVIVDSVRALHGVGLVDEAKSLARETVAKLLSTEK